MQRTKVLTIVQRKGGVGKTTTAVTLAHGLALKGKKVLLIDGDPQGQDAVSLDVQQAPGVFTWLVNGGPVNGLAVCPRAGLPDFRLLPGNARTGAAQTLLAAEGHPLNYIADLLKEEGGAWDWVIFDTSPSVGGIQEMCMYAADFLLVPAQCKYLAADAVAQTWAGALKLVERGWKGRLLGIVPTFFDERVVSSEQTLTELREAYGSAVLPFVVHQAEVIEQASAAGKTIWEYQPRSRAGLEYARLLQHVMKV